MGKRATILAVAALLVVASGAVAIWWLVARGSGGVPACGPAWRLVEAAKPSPIYNELQGVAARFENDVWAVGTWGTEEYALPLVEHFDGTAWKHIEVPAVPDYSNHLYGIALPEPGEAWVVGASHRGTDQWRTLAIHYTADKWTIVQTPSVGPVSTLNAIAALSRGDIWAVGESSSGRTGAGTQALAMHFDGSEWRLVDTGVRRYNGTFSSVVALSANDVWAAGSYTDVSGTVQKPLVVHFDGAKWQEVELPGDGAIWGLSAVPGSGADGMWAVGTFGPQTVAYRQEGGEWKRVPTPNPGQGNNTLNSVVSPATGNAWAVGTTTRDGKDVPLIIHWDGSEWKEAPQAPGRYSDTLSAVAAAPGTAAELWAVGASITDELGNNAPVAMRYSDPCRK